jgi:hypothetical protein
MIENIKDLFLIPRMTVKLRKLFEGDASKGSHYHIVYQVNEYSEVRYFRFLRKFLDYLFGEVKFNQLGDFSLFLSENVPIMSDEDETFRNERLVGDTILKSLS